ncbi:MAG: metallophosphoesterase family protein [Alphaproteobacteria bacterium]|nr:metallophosphoesterase family protein [Alphaproteobacteria bacterium]MBU1561550.1 metallophosphoesterase family protein [Alphaproteobacteria bacterium]MBU2300967.1 metallophosphoesterase family protein [Alphaproteobacteria bacterium]MBU2367249.1 metallophosphoesterase family protein [Alphaproteobacteria bacterium]
MTTYFTADHHFGHAAVIGMCGRPFADVDDMTRGMIHAWNSVVREGDTVWHLGDFSFKGKPGEVRAIFDQLAGTKCLVRGNHDKQNVTQLSWSEQVDFKHLALDGVQVNLSHYAMRSWPAMHRNSYMLYGHSHGALPGSRYTHDVGVDAVGYVPQTLAQLRARMDLLPKMAFDVGRVLEENETPEVAEGFQP